MLSPMIWPYEAPEKEALWPFKYIVTEMPGETGDE
jgi:hypothetical protein